MRRASQKQAIQAAEKGLVACLGSDLILGGLSGLFSGQALSEKLGIPLTGYWFLEPPQGWEPPADLLHFLQSGPPPVYIGFGSMSSSKPEETADIALQALARTGQRGVLYAGWGG